MIYFAISLALLKSQVHWGLASNVRFRQHLGYVKHNVPPCISSTVETARAPHSSGWRCIYSGECEPWLFLRCRGRALLSYLDIEAGRLALAQQQELHASLLQERRRQQPGDTTRTGGGNPAAAAAAQMAARMGRLFGKAGATLGQALGQQSQSGGRPSVNLGPAAVSGAHWLLLGLRQIYALSSGPTHRYIFCEAGIEAIV